MGATARWITLGLVSAASLFGSACLVKAQSTLYGAQFAFDGAFYAVNPATGGLTTVTNQDNGFYAGLDAQPGTGTLYAAEGSFLATVNPATGQPLSEIELTGPGAGDVDSISFSPSGALYGLGNGNGTLYTINPLTGATTLLGSANTVLFGLEFGPDGTLYACDFDLFVLDPANGAILQDKGLLTGTFTNAPLINDLDFAPNGVLYGVSGQITTDSLYSIDPSTGLATLIGPTGGDLRAIASVTVPEPGTWILLVLGGATVLGWRGRRRVAV